ncbi:hypothetical protein QYM36_015466 [Artemia franciscana]|uniref:Uncharacterized protein n=1 Tax=Artemia franciscana TaxID=6661 RepID=A0AA88KZZ8_ARTSF|nr:hypothetical protein QYM36_015466 [Artemia franciscana]
MLVDETADVSNVEQSCVCVSYTSAGIRHPASSVFCRSSWKEQQRRNVRESVANAERHEPVTVCYVSPFRKGTLLPDAAFVQNSLVG